MHVKNGKLVLLPISFSSPICFIFCECQDESPSNNEPRFFRVFSPAASNATTLCRNILAERPRPNTVIRTTCLISGNDSLGGKGETVDVAKRECRFKREDFEDLISMRDLLHAVIGFLRDFKVFSFRRKRIDTTRCRDEYVRSLIIRTQSP